VSIVSSAKGCTFTLGGRPRLAARAHRAFVDIPRLGIAIVRDPDTGAVYVVEENSIGYAWRFSSTSGRASRE
jgi:hypothetical protein